MPVVLCTKIRQWMGTTKTLWSHPCPKFSVPRCPESVVWWNTIRRQRVHFTCIFLSWSMCLKWWLWRYITCQTVTISLVLHGFPNVPAEQWDVQFLQEWGRSCNLQMEGVRVTAFLCVYSTDSLVSVSRYKRSITEHSDGGEIILAGGSTTCAGAAFRHHGDLGAEVEAVACHWGLMVFGIRSQKSLHVPPPPLSFNLRLNLDSVWMRSGEKKFQLFLKK